MGTALARHGRVHAGSFKEFREVYAPWVPDTSDQTEQDIFVRLFEPTGARGQEVDTGTLLMGKLFFPRAVRKMMSRQRYKFLKMLDDEGLPFFCSKAHRTFGKTTWAAIYATRAIAMHLRQFLLYTSSEYKIASRRTEFIRSSLTENQEIIALFGNMKPSRAQKSSAAFSEDAFFLISPYTGKAFACVSPRGSNQTVNGSIAPLGGDELARVDLILNDDGQSRKNISNGNVRDTYEEWCEAELYNTVETDEQPEDGKRWAPRPAGQRTPWRIIEFDTPKHRLALIEKHFDNPAWTHAAFPAAVKGPDGVWRSAHEIYSDAVIQQMVLRHKLRMDSWHREFACLAVASDASLYTKSMFRYCDVKAEMKRRRDCFRFLVVDPSRVGEESANPTSILAVAVDDNPGGGIFLAKHMLGTMESDRYYQATFDMCRELGIGIVYIEETGLAGVLRNAIKTAAAQARVSDQIEFKWLNSRRLPGVDYGTGEDAIKIARGGAMRPYYQTGLVWHDTSMEGGVLEERLLEWPDCSEWGPTDTLGYIPEILEKEEIYLEGYENDLDPIAMETDEYEAAAKYSLSGAWCR